MQDTHDVTQDQAHWLRLLESRQSEGPTDALAIPENILDSLLKKGFVRRWRDGAVAITLGGLREVAQY